MLQAGNVRTNSKNVFGDGLHTESSKDVTEMTQLRPRGIPSNLQSYTEESMKAPPANIVYLEREIMSTDTLQSFALLYGCSVNEIKRANNLINEQDFYALRRLKIPVKRHGLLTEVEEELKRRPVVTTSLDSSLMTAANSVLSYSHQERNQTRITHLANDVYHNLSEEFDSADNLDNSSLLQPLTRIDSANSAIDNNDTSKFLKKVDKEIRKTVRKSDKLDNDRNEVLDEVVSSLGSVGYHPLPFPGSKSREEFDGASWGVKWWTMILCFFLVMVVVGFVIVKMYMQHDEVQPSTPSSNS